MRLTHLALGLLFSLFAALLVSCDWQPSGQRYVLLAASDGKVFRLDAKTGSVHYVSPEGMFSLSEGTPKLKEGQFFQIEDGKFLKYLGHGQFEKADYAIRKVN